MDEEKVFKALADANRRLLLDLLFQRDGQTLSELEAHLPMTRFGAMKHLQILEDAGLLTTRRVGREKYHYLNPVPIHSVYERWVSKYAQPWATTLSVLKQALEEPTVTDAEITSQVQKPVHVFHTFIRTTPEKLWQALTTGEITKLYYFATRIDATWQAGAPYTYQYEGGQPMISGDILELDPPHRLVMTFYPEWRINDQTDRNAMGSRVTWEIEPQGTVCRLTLTHDEPRSAAAINAGMLEGWAQILSGLKTYLETGEPLILRQ